MRKCQTKQSKKPETIRPIHYLGSKLRMLEFIGGTLDSLDPARGTVCDLFSGSGTVSKFLSASRKVVSIDIQEYSRVLCSALLNPGAVEMPAADFLDAVFSSENFRALKAAFSGLIEYENRAMDGAKKGSIENLYEIIEDGSLLKAEEYGTSGCSPAFSDVLRKTSLAVGASGLDVTEKAMVTRYFGGLYFSYEQALQIDAALETAYQSTQYGTPQRDVAIAAILGATSDIVNTVGKTFAQPLQVRDGSGKLKGNLLPKILGDRAMPFFERLLHWLAKYHQLEPSAAGHEIIKADYRKALEGLRGKKVSVIYADPPYTRYHYSRYYHVLETICLRDAPEVSSTFANREGMSRGIYRKDRHQSPFSIKTKAPGAFGELFERASAIDAPLVLSYSPTASQPATPRMQAIDKLIEQAKSRYAEVELRSPGYFAHSKLNAASRNFGTDTEAELLLICRH